MGGKRGQMGARTCVFVIPGSPRNFILMLTARVHVYILLLLVAYAAAQVSVTYRFRLEAECTGYLGDHNLNSTIQQREVRTSTTCTASTTCTTNIFMGSTVYDCFPQASLANYTFPTAGNVLYTYNDHGCQPAKLFSQTWYQIGGCSGIPLTPPGPDTGNMYGAATCANGKVTVNSYSDDQCTQDVAAEPATNVDSM